MLTTDKKAGAFTPRSPAPQKAAPEGAARKSDSHLNEQKATVTFYAVLVVKVKFNLGYPYKEQGIYAGVVFYQCQVPSTKI